MCLCVLHVTHIYVCLCVCINLYMHVCVSLRVCLCGYMCVYICVCVVGSRKGAKLPLSHSVLCAHQEELPSLLGQLHRHRAWVAEWGLDSSLHQPSHLASCRRKHLGRGGGHFGRAGSPFALIFAMQGPSQRIQSENYPNQCSLMVSKCHDSREVHGSISLTDVHILYRLQGQPLTQPLRP